MSTKIKFGLPHSGTTLQTVHYQGLRLVTPLGYPSTRASLQKAMRLYFNEELFKVAKVIRGDPNVYEIEDHEGEPIIRNFDKEELLAVDKKDDIYRVEKILKRKNM